MYEKDELYNAHFARYVDDALAQKSGWKKKLFRTARDIGRLEGKTWLSFIGVGVAGGIAVMAAAMPFSLTLAVIAAPLLITSACVIGCGADIMLRREALRNLVRDYQSGALERLHVQSLYPSLADRAAGGSFSAATRREQAGMAMIKSLRPGPRS